MNKQIHQVYGIFRDAIPIKEMPLFYDNVRATKDFAKKNGYKYKMWDKKQSLNLIKNSYPQYLKVYNSFPLDIQRADFIRYAILDKYGGIYIDADVRPIKSLDTLFSRPYFFVHWNTDKSKTPYNAVMGSHKNNPLFKDILKHSEESYYKIKDKPAYQGKLGSGARKGRFVNETTGGNMIKRVFNQNKISLKNVLNILKVIDKNGKVRTSGKSPFFMDFNASEWYKKGVGGI